MVAIREKGILTDEKTIQTVVAAKKAVGIQNIAEYGKRYSEGLFDSDKYTLDNILDIKISRNAKPKYYNNVAYSSSLPRVDEFISDKGLLDYMKNLVPENELIQNCNTVPELARCLHDNPIHIELVSFQNAAPNGANVLKFNGNLGNTAQNIYSGGGLYSTSERKLAEFARDYPDLCSYTRGEFAIKDGCYKEFGDKVLSGVSLSDKDGAYMIITNVRVNGDNISMPSVNNWSAFMDQFVSGGYLLSNEVEVTQKALTDIISNAKSVPNKNVLVGQVDETAYAIYILK